MSSFVSIKLSSKCTKVLVTRKITFARESVFVENRMKQYAVFFSDLFVCTKKIYDSMQRNLALFDHLLLIQMHHLVWSPLWKCDKKQDFQAKFDNCSGYFANNNSTKNLDLWVSLSFCPSYCQDHARFMCSSHSLLLFNIYYLIWTPGGNLIIKWDFPATWGYKILRLLCQQ